LKALIVTADDFGAAPEVNEAVEEAHHRGILTSASLIVGGIAAADALIRAKRMPSLRVGLHLTLLEGRPVLPKTRVPDLIADEGQFRTDMKGFSATIFARPSVRRQVAEEITAQFEAFRATGLPLDHVNAHKHFHLHPAITSLILRIGSAYGMRAVRVPYEPRDVLRRVVPGESLDLALDTRPWALLLRERLRRAAILGPDYVFGLRWSGSMTKPRLAGIIAHLPQGLSEIYLHPATEAYDGAACGYQYRAEFEALCDSEIAAKVRQSGIRTGGYVDFTAMRKHSAAAQIRHLESRRRLFR